MFLKVRMEIANY